MESMSQLFNSTENLLAHGSYCSLKLRDFLKLDTNRTEFEERFQKAMWNLRALCLGGLGHGLSLVSILNKILTQLQGGQPPSVKESA